MRRASLLLLLLLAAAGCGGGEDEAASAPGGSVEKPNPTVQGATPRAQATPEATRRARAAQQGDAPVRARRGPRVQVLARNLEVPWDIAFLPDGRALVTERPGRVRLLDARGRLRAQPAATVPTQARGEGGLLGIAVDPDFAQGRRFVYLYVTTGQGMQVQRWRVSGSRLRRDGLVLGGIRAGSIHDSGRLRFGPDEQLYVATGDAGDRPLSQRRDSRNGKILRLSQRAYRGSGGRPAIHALGLRNPQGLAWQPRSGRLFAPDHGPSGFDGPGGDDEVNVIRRGANYGWPEVRGRAHGRFAAPVQVYPQAIAPSGAAFLSTGGSSWTGDLFVAALRGRALRRLTLDGTTLRSDQALFPGRYGRLRAVVEAPDGTLWVTTSNRDGYGTPRDARDDRLLRVVPPAN